jgi:hypothetical protein
MNCSLPPTFEGGKNKITSRVVFGGSEREDRRKRKTHASHHDDDPCYTYLYERAANLGQAPHRLVLARSRCVPVPPHASAEMRHRLLSAVVQSGMPPEAGGGRRRQLPRDAGDEGRH